MAIESRSTPSGTQLPAEHELVDRFGVSRMTVREGLRILRSEGLLRSAHGVGVFVAEMPDVSRSLAGADLEISPTPAMKAGTQVVHQCSWCGAVVVWTRTTAREHLTNCPACRTGAESAQTTWWEQRLPIAGIHRSHDITQRSTTDD